MSRDRQHVGVPRPEPAIVDDEPTLIARSRQGDVTAFNCLVERYQESAYSLAVRMLGSADAAADVTQDAFFSAFRAIAGFRGTAFRPWLLRIVSNGCYDLFREQSRHPSVSLDAMLHPTENEDHGSFMPSVFQDRRWDPERAALRGEVIQLIHAALLELAPEQRLAVVLSDVQGFSYEEIAEIMQTSLGTVKSRISRGRGRMRDLLQAHRELFPSADRRPSDDVK
jgi:RNA polymerase sigma-70 factor (ECF subfamily)